MKKAGKIDSITTKDTSFAGSGVEGQKGAEEEPASEEEPAAEEKPAAASSFDKTGAASVVTHRDGPKRVWFRDGKEIGVEDVG